jgi:two-component system chemotaxis sensor kinase CheA
MAGLSRRGDEIGAIKVDMRKLDNLVDAVGELIIVQSLIQEDPVLLGHIDQRLAGNLGQLKRITAGLQRSAMALRMVPIRQSFQKVSRIVRDLSRKAGKSVELVLSGEDTELDRKVVEEIADPLMHMVRNSLDHGIEPEDARKKAGKRPRARISLSAYHQGGHIVIEIADDGRGLDTEKIKARAIGRGLIPPVMSGPELLRELQRQGRDTPARIVVSTDGSQARRREMEGLARWYVNKPLRPEVVRDVLNELASSIGD